MRPARRPARSPAMFRWLLALLALLLPLTGCMGDLLKRVSPPAVAIQQLTVEADGHWRVQLRINNFSNLPMRFSTIALEVQVQGIAAGTLQATPNLDIGPTSADVTELRLLPTADARIALATALASGQGIAYALKGTVSASADGARTRDYPLHADSRLNPAPGLSGVLR